MTLRLPIVCALSLSVIAPIALAQTRQSGSDPHKAGTPAPAAAENLGTTASDPGTQAERDRQARVEFERGRKAFDEGDYRGAWGFFHNAYRLSGRAQLLYNIGQTADRLGRDSEALTAFRMYLEQLPKADNRRDVENRIRALEERVKAAERVPPPPGSQSLVLEPVPPPTAAATPVAAQPPKVEAERAPPPPSPPKAEEPRPTHKNWYFRLGLGAGLRHDGVKGGTEGAVNGFGFAGEFGVGYAVWPGFVLGGALYSDFASSPKFKAENGSESDLKSTQLSMLGPMADWYPLPLASGFHVQAALTFAVIAVAYETAGLSIGRDASGVGAVIGVGYEWPIADEWGLGILGRLSLATLSDDQLTHGVFAPSILATLTWY